MERIMLYKKTSFFDHFWHGVKLQRQTCCIWKPQLELGSLTQPIPHPTKLLVTRSQASLFNSILG